jgi:hypothetical protein
LKADALNAIQRAYKTAEGMASGLDKDLILTALAFADAQVAAIQETKRVRKPKAAGAGKKAPKEPVA